jgi:hypothetical protein
MADLQVGASGGGTADERPPRERGSGALDLEVPEWAEKQP